jgi:bifunctional non-homologous end joining protein LigD
MRKQDLKPMLATLVPEPFNDSEWVFETKWDGFRLVADIERHEPTLYSRNGRDVTRRYDVIVPALRKIEHACVLDGELVALDSKGHSRFQLLQNALNTQATIRYCVFDLLFLDGADMRRRPLLQRKQALRDLLPRDRRLRFSAHVPTKGIEAFAQAKRAGEEGIIAKRASSRYFSGKRTREWLKIKSRHEQEAVVVGFSEPQGSRSHFGALVLAVRGK